VRLEDIDYILFTDEEERAEIALENYLDQRSRKSNNASTDYRYFVLGEDRITIVEDIRIGEEMIYNRIDYTEENMKIERNLGNTEVKELLGSR
jgi:hypothetical protein